MRERRKSENKGIPEIEGTGELRELVNYGNRGIIGNEGSEGIGKFRKSEIKRTWKLRNMCNVENGGIEGTGEVRKKRIQGKGELRESVGLREQGHDGNWGIKGTRGLWTKGN